MSEEEEGVADCDDCNVPLSIVNFASTVALSSEAALPPAAIQPEAVAFSVRPSVVMPHLLKLPPSFAARPHRVARFGQAGYHLVACFAPQHLLWTCSQRCGLLCWFELEHKLKGAAI